MFIKVQFKVEIFWSTNLNIVSSPLQQSGQNHTSLAEINRLYHRSIRSKLKDEANRHK